MTASRGAGPVRIGNCSGFYGDRSAAMREMLTGGDLDYLTGDYLAELTMLILGRDRMKNPERGYAKTFLTQLEECLGLVHQHRVRIVANAGGLNPAGLAAAVRDLADRLGVPLTVAHVEGDDLLARSAELGLGSPLTANAYLGAWGIVECLNSGADIVVTGRVTDASVVVGPAAAHFGWQAADYDRIAGAVVAGHVIECGTQATGGNYSFFTELDGLERTGFPWAEIAADGGSVIGKHEGTGGAVTVGTVTSQLLYEIGSPLYLGPDVTARFDTISLEQTARDRVRISGTLGEPPPSTLKVSMNELGGFRTDLNVALTGLDIEAKAELVERAFWEACTVDRDEIESVTTRLVRTDKPDPPTNEEAVAVWQITLKDHDERKVKGASTAVNELALATIPGLFGASGMGVAKPFGVHRAGMVDADLVPQHVVILGGARTVVESTAPAAPGRAAAGPGRSEGAVPSIPDGPTVRAPLGAIFGARSGDKGGDANLGVFARSADAYAWLAEHLSVERLRGLLPEAAPLPIERHELPNLWSLNFVIHGLLQEGVAASTRQDAQAKGLGEWLRAREVDLPASLLDGSRP